ncbi:MAG: sugar phosphate isomerase/epimerase [Solirubrobacterales bacterium]
MSWPQDAEITASFFTLSGAPAPEPARRPFEERVKAAADAGLDGIGLLYEEQSTLAAGAPGDMRKLVDSYGIAVDELEFMPFWARPEGDPEYAFSASQEKRIYELAEELGSTQMNAGMIDPIGELPPEEFLAERFAALCDRAKEHGLRVALEAMPAWCLQTPTKAWEIVRMAGRENAGVLIDAYHFYRGGADFEALRAIPAERIAGVQINDAPAEPQGDLATDGSNFRVPPGEGELDLPKLLLTLAEMGVKDLPVCIEVFSKPMMSLPVQEVAQRMADGARAVIAAVPATAG